MISTKSFEKGHKFYKNFGFFEIPYLERGTAFLRMKLNYFQNFLLYEASYAQNVSLWTGF